MDFSLKTTEGRRKWHNMLKLLKSTFNPEFYIQQNYCIEMKEK